MVRFSIMYSRYIVSRHDAHISVSILFVTILALEGLYIYLLCSGPLRLLVLLMEALLAVGIGSVRNDAGVWFVASCRNWSLILSAAPTRSSCLSNSLPTNSPLPSMFVVRLECGKFPPTVRYQRTVLPSTIGRKSVIRLRLWLRP